MQPCAKQHLRRSLLGGLGRLPRLLLASLHSTRRSVFGGLGGAGGGAGSLQTAGKCSTDWLSPQHRTGHASRSNVQGVLEVFTAGLEAGWKGRTPRV
jgi:hypothetical protein